MQSLYIHIQGEGIVPICEELGKASWRNWNFKSKRACVEVLRHTHKKKETIKLGHVNNTLFWDEPAEVRS